MRRQQRAQAGPTKAPVPIVVVEGSPEAYRQAVEDLRAGGWLIREGFEPGRGAPNELRAGAVADAESAGRAVIAVLAGTGVLVHALAVGEVLDRLLDDLRHLGQVDHRIGAGAPALSQEARELLSRLAAGETLGEAAHAMHVSRRTADRRLGEARRVLGVDRTVEAIGRARRLGWLG